MERKNDEEITEITKPIIPIVIEVKSILDMMEACPTNGIILHKELQKEHYYYYYISVGETLVVLMLYKTDKAFKRYIGNSKGKTLENDEPNSDCFIPIVEVNTDPILELSVMVEENEDGNKKVS